MNLTIMERAVKTRESKPNGLAKVEGAKLTDQINMMATQQVVENDSSIKHQEIHAKGNLIPSATIVKLMTTGHTTNREDETRGFPTTLDMDVSEMSDLIASHQSSPAVSHSRDSELDLPRGVHGLVHGTLTSSIKTPPTAVFDTLIRNRSDDLSQPEVDAVNSDSPLQSKVVPPSKVTLGTDVSLVTKFNQFPDTNLSHPFQVRPYSVDKTKNIRTLGLQDIDQLVTITGLVTHAREFIPKMAEAVFRCTKCKYTVTGELEKPTFYQHCPSNHSRYSTEQILKIQESSDDIPAGQTPHTVILYPHGDRLHTVQPGDLVSITGVYRVVPSNDRLVCKKHIDVVHCRKICDLGHHMMETQQGVVKENGKIDVLKESMEQQSRLFMVCHLDNRVANVMEKSGEKLCEMRQYNSSMTPASKFSSSEKMRISNPDYVTLSATPDHMFDEVQYGLDNMEVHLDNSSSTEIKYDDSLMMENIPQLDGGDDPADGENALNFEVHDNHIAKVADVFFKGKSCMVRLDLQFFPTDNNPPETHTVIIPLEIFEDNPRKAKKDMRDQVIGIVPFIFNIDKYCNKIVAEVQQFIEHQNKDGTEKEFIRHEKPTIFEFEGVTYYSCGELWRLSEPGHKIELPERNELPFFLVYTANPIVYEDNMKTLVEGVLLLLQQMNSMQPVQEDHSWPFIKMSMHFQSQLYAIIAHKYGQATVINNSGEENTNVGKTFWQVILDYLTTGFHDVSGDFTLKTVFDKLTAGVPAIVDEVTDFKKQGAIIQTVVSHTFNPKERSVGRGGGKPKAAFSVNCNPTRAQFNFPKNVDTKICWIWAGSTPLQATTEEPDPKKLQETMVVLARQLNKNLPNLLMLTAQCFSWPMTDDEMRKVAHLTEGSERLAQILVSIDKFAKILLKQAELLHLQVPRYVKQVDFGPILVNYVQETASKQDLFKYFIDNDLTDKLKKGKKDNQEGFRFNGNIVVNCPAKIYQFVSKIKGLPDGAKRWKFVRTDDVKAKEVWKLRIGNLELSNAWKRDFRLDVGLRGKLEAELISSTEEDGTKKGDTPTQAEQSTSEFDDGASSSKTKPSKKKAATDPSEPKMKKTKKNAVTGPIPCTFEDCGRSFPTTKGLNLHLSRTHKTLKK